MSTNQQSARSEGTEIGDEDALRANFYGLLARVLAKPMDDVTLESMRTLADHDDSTPLGNAIASFGKLCLRTPHAKAEAEYSVLFYGVGAGGELSPYASIYLTGLLTGAFGGDNGRAQAKVFFDKHLAPWADKFFKDLEGAQSAALYMPVGTIGRLFMEIEREAFEMAA